MNSAVKTSWAKAVQVEAVEPGVLHVEWDNGDSGVLDVRHLLERDRFWRLRQFRYFRQVGIDELGALCWPDGEDLAPDGLSRFLVNR